jgi:hypothetical protein
MWNNGRFQKSVVIGLMALSYICMSYAVWYDEQHREEREFAEAERRAGRLAQARPLTREDYERVAEAFKKRHGYT